MIMIRNEKLCDIGLVILFLCGLPLVLSLIDLMASIKLVESTLIWYGLIIKNIFMLWYILRNHSLELVKLWLTLSTYQMINIIKFEESNIVHFTWPWCLSKAKGLSFEVHSIIWWTLRLSGYLIFLLYYCIFLFNGI